MLIETIFHALYLLVLLSIQSLLIKELHESDQKVVMRLRTQDTTSLLRQILMHHSLRSHHQDRIR